MIKYHGEIHMVLMYILNCKPDKKKQFLFADKLKTLV